MSVTAKGSLSASGKTKMHNLSLDLVASRALVSLAAAKGPRYKLSWVVEDLIDGEMRSKLGRDWRDQLEAEMAAEESPSS